MKPAEIQSAIDYIRHKIKEASDWVPIGTQQRESARAQPVREPVWLSKATFPSPADDGVRQALFGVVEALGDKDGSQQWTRPTYAERGVEGEWITARKIATGEKGGVKECSYADMDREAMGSKKTILYIHGGNFYRGSPAASRSAIARLAHHTPHRLLAIRYRLAPQNPFPAGLLDLLQVYLSLLYPPPGSPYTSIHPSDILITGESSGGNLALSLLLVILHLHKHGVGPHGLTIHGQKIDKVPLPARVATISAFTDVTQSLPSTAANLATDVVLNTSVNYGPTFPGDAIWPTTPPRGHIYCEASMLDHPLVSPAAAAASCWRGAPTMLIVVGEELLMDGNRWVAQQAARQGVAVKYSVYMGMPHLFPVILPKSKQARMAWEEWAEFLRRDGGSSESQGRVVEMTPLGEIEIRETDSRSLVQLEADEVRRLMRGQRDMTKVWAGPTERTPLAKGSKL